MQQSKLEVYLKTFPTEKYPEGVIIKSGKKLPPGSLRKLSGEVSSTWHDFREGEITELKTGEIEVIITGQAYKIGEDWKLYELGEDYGLLAILREDGTIVPKLQKARQKERYSLMKKEGMTPLSQKLQSVNSFMQGDINPYWPIIKRLWINPEPEITKEITEILETIEASGVDVSNPHLNLDDLEDKILQEQEDLAPEVFEDEDLELGFEE